MTRVLIIGTGSIGERHLRCFRNTGRASVSFCEPVASRREEIKARYGLDCAFADLDDAMHENWDASVVCTPAHLHIPIAQRLAEAGIHVLIEKPLSTSLEGVAELVTIAERRRVLL